MSSSKASNKVSKSNESSVDLSNLSVIPQKSSNIDYDIKIKLLEHVDEIDGYETSYCKLNMSGRLINTVIVNTLRRVILTLIPTYGFNTENINITKNTSIFNNDYMRLRLSNFPIYLTKELNNKYIKKMNLENVNVINNESTLEKSSELEYRANLGSAEKDVTEDKMNKPDLTDNLQIVVNVKNHSDNDIMNVMSNTLGVKYYYGKAQISHIFTNPLLIIQLQPGQEFSCSMISNLNIAMFNAIYSPCSMCFFEEKEDDKGEEDVNDFDFTVMSRRQISEKDMLIRACKIIQKKIAISSDIFTKSISKYNNDSVSVSSSKNVQDGTGPTELNHLQNGTIIIPGEQHTLGNLISRYLQEHPDIKFAGYKVGHPNVSQVDIRYICKTDILVVIKDVVKKINDIFEIIKTSIEKMPDFGYKYI